MTLLKIFEFCAMKVEFETKNVIELHFLFFFEVFAPKIFRIFKENNSGSR